MKIPANKSLRGRARELRKNSTLAEVLFWNVVKNKQLNGLDFDRQKVIGNYIVDFYCPQLNVVIEIDGCSHATKQEYDKSRDEYLKSLGMHILHVYDEDVKRDMDGVLRMVSGFCEKYLQDK
ncbi:MAG: endonuclease domain-containing protein [Alphaproteobacteria bacterium]|nr:endonuclease domain-containing protein [Alphaproteobacteria bacterium]